MCQIFIWKQLRLDTEYVIGIWLAHPGKQPRNFLDHGDAFSQERRIMIAMQRKKQSVSV
jgi:hypothetical protein